MAIFIFDHFISLHTATFHYQPSMSSQFDWQQVHQPIRRQVILNSLTQWLSRLHNSTHSQTHTFGTGTKCPSKSDLCLIESKIMGVKKGRDQLKVCVLVRCSSYRRVRWERINCTIHTCNLLIQWNLDITNRKGTRKICLLLQGFIISKFFLIITGVEKIIPYLTKDFIT